MNRTKPAVARGTRKVAISLPAGLLARVEVERRARQESRSAFLRRAIELFFAASRQADRVREYAAAYRRHPETEDEVAAADAAAAELLAAEPWE